MKVEVVPFKGEYLRRMALKQTSRYNLSLITEEAFEQLEKNEFNYTFLMDGRPVFCGGIVTFWPGRGEVWAFLDEVCRSEFILIHKMVVRYLKVFPHKRLEATVEKEFEPGHRWMRLLGFNVEAPLLRAYYPQGTDGVLYAKVRD
jgi:hypothetical protein